MANSKKKTVVITGATSGLGLAAMKGLAEEGYRLIGVARSPEKIEAAKNALKEGFPDTEFRFIKTDLSSQTQIRDLAKQIATQLKEWDTDCLDVLVNNAGAVTSWYTLTEDGIERQFAVNHLAPFLLTHLLLPSLQRAPQGRVLTVSSGSHRHTRIHWKDVMFSHHYGTLKAYKQSKLANVLFSMTFNRKFSANSQVRAYAVDPGLINTQIGAKDTNGFVKWFWGKRSSHGNPPEVAAETIIYLACRSHLPYKNQWYFKECHPVEPSPYAQQEEPAERLWQLSLHLCGLEDIKSQS
ncbi:MAG: SDR family NAD(P)-dependent oxidoreductase [Anaerolineaceae bacterium]|nr:SDR family NAD(P)-dependent oxidoreductase [Anaerolineaceae bacterium]